MKRSCATGMVVQGAAAVNAFLDDIMKVAHEKLATEQKQAPPANTR